jgi:uncharacterized protein YecT (DUF1311 family)
MWRVLPFCTLLAVLGSEAGTVKADELDGWCAQVSKASSIVICSDAELRQQAINRNELFETARQSLSPIAYKALSDDQTRWVKAYTARCGISIDGPVPSLPIQQSVIDCYKRESRARTSQLAARLWHEVSRSAPTPEPPPAAAVVPAPAPQPMKSPAKTTTGYDLYLSCSSENINANEYLRCLNLLHGLWDGAMTIQNFGKDRIFCPKTSIQVGQMALIYQDWAQKHPADLGHGASDAAIASFIDAFPCPSPPSATSRKLELSTEPSGADFLLK